VRAIRVVPAERARIRRHTDPMPNWLARFLLREWRDLQNLARVGTCRAGLSKDAMSMPARVSFWD
jgi:hypothetical protein